MFVEHIESKIDAPAPRCGHRSVAYKESIYIFGGNTSTGIFNPTYGISKTLLHRYNTLTREWRIIDIGLPYIEKLTAFGSFLCGDTLHCFSGSTEVESIDKPLSFWSFNFPTEDVEFGAVIFPGIRNPFQGRYGLTACHYRKNIKDYAVIYGGDNNLLRQNYPELLVVDLETKTCVKRVSTPKLSLEVPFTDLEKEIPLLPRSFHTAVMRNSSEMIVFGGMKHFNTTDNAMVNDLLKFDLETDRIELIYSKGHFDPPGRRSHGAIMGKNDEMFIFGGFGTKLLNDLWKFNFTTSKWTEIEYLGKENVKPTRFFSMELFYGGIYIFGGVNKVYEDQDDQFLVLDDFVRINLERDPQKMIASRLRKEFEQCQFADLVIRFQK